MKADHRLRKDAQIRQVLDKGQPLRGRDFLLRILPSREIIPQPAGTGPFFAVVISRKKEKRATARNRMKRRLREIFRKWCGELPDGSACVAVVRSCGRSSFQEIEKDFLDTIGKKTK